MRKHGKHRKYTVEEILEEAQVFINSNMTMREVAAKFKMPKSTLAWHLRCALARVDHSLWLAVNDRCVENRHVYKRYGGGVND